MKYSKEVYSKAEDELNRRHIKAMTEFERRQNEIEIKAPEIAAVNRKLINTSVEISKVLLNKQSDIKSAIDNIKKQNLQSQMLIKNLLVDFGYDEDYLDIHYTCDFCKDTGYVNGIRCRCFNDLLRSFAVKEMNKESNVKLENFKDFEISYYPDETDINTKINPRQKMTANYQACREYVKNFSLSSPSLFFSGKTGLGKTFMSSCIANELLLNGFNVAFDTIQNYLRCIENEHFGRSTDFDTLNILSNADLVILDDLGSEFTSAFYSSALYNIINTRLNKGVPTIISSNMTLAELQNKYDDRIISRLTGMFSWMIFLGKDIRHIKAIRNKI